ncbi:unnamed protein product, partial [Ostreobium quekettii]
HREKPQRPLFVWALDVGKQGVSALACHFANLTISLLVSMDNTETSQCSFYFAIYNIDQALGTTTTIIIHKTLVGIAKKARRDRRRSEDHELDEGISGKRWGVLEAISLCGFYGEPPSLRRWGIQVSEWVGAVLLARCVSGSFDLLMKDVLLVHVARAVDGRFDGHPRALLFFVMVFYPLLVNITMACIVDGVLKRKKKWHRLGNTLHGEEAPLISGVSSPDDGHRDCELSICSDLLRYESDSVGSPHHYAAGKLGPSSPSGVAQ